MTWVDVGPVASVPERGARVVRLDGADVAVFRSGSGAVYALHDRCPHRGGPLSQGIVHAECVTCPLHEWVIDLASGAATGADSGATATFAVRVADGRIWLDAGAVAAHIRDDAARADATSPAVAAPNRESPRFEPTVRDDGGPAAYALFERA